MKLRITLLILILPLIGFSQTIVGKWKTIDDVTGNAKSIIQIYKENGKFYGKVIQILTPGEENKVCSLCEDDKKDQPIVGMILLTDLVEDDDEWNEGEILDPNNGSTYSCYVSLESNEKLKVRGYIGFSLIGRTQYWYRID